MIVSSQRVAVHLIGILGAVLVTGCTADLISDAVGSIAAAVAPTFDSHAESGSPVRQDDRGLPGLNGDRDALWPAGEP